jgi:cytochrome c peroxidase
MNKAWTFAVVVVAATIVAARPAAPQDAKTADSPTASGEYQWKLPKGFPKPRVPADNPMSEAKVTVGRYLFYDKRLSGNGSQACASCHQQALAFTDGRAQGLGSTNESHTRGAMSLVNIAYSSALTWSNPSEHSLEHQALTPMFGRQPVELGLPDGAEYLWATFRIDPIYGDLMHAAFPGPNDPFTLDNVTKAIAAFERTIISADSPYDRYHYDRDDDAISESAKHGEVLFFSEQLSCFRCHGGFNFSSDATFEGSRGSGDDDGDGRFHNTGLYNVSGPTSYPEPNVGIYQYTKQPGDVGKFKAPTLRNVALTAPYMHDGSVATLNDVLDHYAAGGRTITSGPNAGDGSQNPNKDPLIRGFKLSAQDRADLIAFLQSLTDEEVIHDARFANPWPTQPTLPGTEARGW